MARRDEKIKFVKRVVIGSRDPDNPAGEEESEKAMALLNRCISRTGRGQILAIEKNFKIKKVGESQAVMQNVTYHIGFERKPYWLEEETSGG